MGVLNEKRCKINIFSNKNRLFGQKVDINVHFLSILAFFSKVFLKKKSPEYFQKRKVDF